MEDKVDEKRSLMNAYENLHSKVNQLAEVEGLSDTMIQKFLRAENDPVAESDNDENKPRPPKPGIIDSFYNLADDFDKQMGEIANNIERMINWIG